MHSWILDGVDGDTENQHHLACPFLECHLNTECPGGFRLDKFGCQTCQCSPKKTKMCPDMTHCDKHCSFGYQKDEENSQCSICECRDSADIKSEVEADGHNLLLSSPDSTKCHTVDINGSNLVRLSGEEWRDQCRRCICKNGTEMCTLITCQPPNCEHPIFFQGECCPRCPGI